MSTPREACLHDADLGKRLSVDEIRRLVAESPEEPLLRALLQHLRNHAAQCSRHAGAYLAEDKPHMCHWATGGADSLSDLFWEILGWMPADAGGEASLDDDEENEVQQ